MIEITPTEPRHVLKLRDNLREEDFCEIVAFGLPVRKALWRSYKASIICRTALVDGVVAGIWGVTGTVLGHTGRPWLLTSPVCNQFPLQFALLHRQEINEMLSIFPRLENYVEASYQKSIRLLELTGFTLHNPEPYGYSGALFRRFEKAA